MWAINSKPKANIIDANSKPLVIKVKIEAIIITTAVRLSKILKSIAYLLIVYLIRYTFQDLPWHAVNSL